MVAQEEADGSQPNAGTIAVLSVVGACCAILPRLSKESAVLAVAAAAAVAVLTLLLLLYRARGAAAEPAPTAKAQPDRAAVVAAVAKAKAEQAKAEQAKAAQAKAEQAKAAQVKSEQAKAEQAKAAQAKAEQEKAEREKAEQEEAAQSSTPVREVMYKELETPQEKAPRRSRINSKDNEVDAIWDTDWSDMTTARQDVPQPQVSLPTEVFEMNDTPTWLARLQQRRDQAERAGKLKLVQKIDKEIQDAKDGAPPPSRKCAEEAFMGDEDTDEDVWNMDWAKLPEPTACH